MRRNGLVLGARRFHFTSSHHGVGSLGHDFISQIQVRVMFIQSQHSNTSGGVALQHIHKKRRLDHHQQQVDYSNGDNLYALNAGGIVNNLNQTVVQRHVQRTLNTNNNVQNKSPNGGVPQQFIRASTIKLLDTYQRCGQKVNCL
ncbi:unnamed protein product, partial [Timema podura]|nr:unnamed protein product [Timema podura]